MLTKEKEDTAVSNWQRNSCAFVIIISIVIV
jgi:hypothetical protein